MYSSYGSDYQSRNGVLEVVRAGYSGCCEGVQEERTVELPVTFSYVLYNCSVPTL